MGEALSGFSSSEPWGALEGPQADVSAASCATLDVIPSTEARVAGESPGLAQPAQANPSAGRTQRREGKAGEAVPADNKSEEGMEAEECRGLEGGLQGGAEADAEAEAGNTSAQKTPWDCYVIVHSVSKKHNIGMLLRSATAFGVRQMVVVGRRDISTFGHHGTADYVDLKHFYHMKDARSYLKERGCTICGVEIVEGAQAIQSHPFTGHTAFLLGNEGSGLSQQELAFCDRFVYIPQYGEGTASLNVVVAASIILHHFAVWAKYEERQSSGGKFLVGERPMQRRSRNSCPEDAEEVLERRRERDRAAAEDDWVENGDSSLFGGELEVGGLNIQDKHV